MAKKPVYVLTAVCGLGLAAAGAWWLQKPAAPVATEAPSAGARAAGSAGSGGGPGPGGPGGGQRGGGVPAVEVAQVATAALQDDAQAVGTVRSRQSVTLRPEVSGRIAALSFQEGAAVRRGQVLIKLDDTLQRAELSQAEAQLSIARANLKRNQELVAANFVAQRVLDEGQASLQVAEAQVALARARLERMVVRAPFDGVVGLRLVDLGAYVKDGADLVNIEDTSQLMVDYRLPERYQTRVREGQAVEVSLDALPGQRMRAQIVAVDPQLDTSGRSLLVRAALPAPAGTHIRPGMFARVTTVFEVFEQAVMVPEEALVPQAGKQIVYRVEREGDGESAKTVSRRVEVELGARRGPQVQVLSGLQAGDTIVVAGQQRLQRDGTAVRVVDMSRGQGGAGRPPGGNGRQKPGGGANEAPAGEGRPPKAAQSAPA